MDSSTANGGRDELAGGSNSVEQKGKLMIPRVLHNKTVQCLGVLHKKKVGQISRILELAQTSHSLSLECSKKPNPIQKVNTADPFLAIGFGLLGGTLLSFASHWKYISFASSFIPVSIHIFHTSTTIPLTTSKALSVMFALGSRFHVTCQSNYFLCLC